MRRQQGDPQATARQPYTLPALPYEYAALEPWIDQDTLRLHHDFHHRRCVEALNRVEDHLLQLRDRAEPKFIEQLERVVAWRVSEHQLHSLYWEGMGPHQGGQPRGEIAEHIVDDFDSFADFKWRFSAVANGLTAGGWVVLALHPMRRRLLITTAGRHDQDLDGPIVPLLSLDVWAHAYCLKYQERRTEYVHNWWNTVNWSRIAQRFDAAVHPTRAWWSAYPHGSQPTEPLHVNARAGETGVPQRVVRAQ